MARDEGALTVNEALHILQEMVAKNPRQAEAALVVPYDAGRTAMGSHTAQPVVGLHLGFDWNAGRVMLMTKETLGPPDPALQTLKKRIETLHGNLYQMRRALDDENSTEVARIEAVRHLLEQVFPKVPRLDTAAEPKSQPPKDE